MINDKTQRCEETFNEASPSSVFVPLNQLLNASFFAE